MRVASLLALLACACADAPPSMLVLDRVAATAVSKRWRARAWGVDAIPYGAAQAVLQSSAAVGILDAQLNLYVGHAQKGGEVHLACILWREATPSPRPADKTSSLRRLRRWHAHHFPDAPLVGDGLCDDEDLVCWCVSAGVHDP